MSRIGKLPVPVPSGVDVTIDGARVTVKVMPSGASKVIGWLYPSWNSSWVGPLDRTR